MSQTEFQQCTGRSAVWEHFLFQVIDGKADRSYAYCKHCDDKVKNAGNTTNLFNHVRRIHPRVCSQTEPMFWQDDYGQHSMFTSRTNDDVPSDFATSHISNGFLPEWRIKVEKEDAINQLSDIQVQSFNEFQNNEQQRKPTSPACVDRSVSSDNSRTTASNNRTTASNIQEEEQASPATTATERLCLKVLETFARVRCQRDTAMLQWQEKMLTHMAQYQERVRKMDQEHEIRMVNIFEKLCKRKRYEDESVDKEQEESRQKKTKNDDEESGKRKRDGDDSLDEEQGESSQKKTKNNTENDNGKRKRDVGDSVDEQQTSSQKRSKNIGEDNGNKDMDNVNGETEDVTSR